MIPIFCISGYPSPSCVSVHLRTSWLIFWDYIRWFLLALFAHITSSLHLLTLWLCGHCPSLHTSASIKVQLPHCRCMLKDIASSTTYLGFIGISSQRVKWPWHVALSVVFQSHSVVREQVARSWGCMMMLSHVVQVGESGSLDREKSVWTAIKSQCWQSASKKKGWKKLKISALTDINTNSDTVCSGGTEAERACVMGLGVGTVGGVVGRGVSGMEAEGGDEDIIISWDENRSFSHVRILSGERFWNCVAPVSHELKRISNSMRVATALGLQNRLRGQFLMVTPYFWVIRLSKRLYCMRRLVVPVMAPTSPK